MRPAAAKRVSRATFISDPMTIGETLMAAQLQLAPISDSPRLDAEILLGHVLGLSRAQLFVRLHGAVDATARTEFETLVKRRARAEPVAYLTGEKGFWTLTLKVTPAVLVPRPETELLVEWALELLRARVQPRVADLGTGSGAIALAIAVERADAAVTATDYSDAALELARENAQQLGLQRVNFCSGNWLDALPDARYDLIVSNPPYIARDDSHLAALRHEPLMALTDGGDGLNALREIIAGARARLSSGGALLLEHGYDQAAAVRGMLQQAGFARIETRRDLSGHERASAGACA